MYFARYATESISLSQVIVRIKTIPFVTGEHINIWNESYCSFLKQLLDWGQVDISFRMQLKDQSLTRLIIITTPFHLESEVEHFIRMMISKLN